MSPAAPKIATLEKLLNNMNEWVGVMGVAVPIVAILMPVAIVFIALYFRHQRQVSLRRRCRGC